MNTFLTKHIPDHEDHTDTDDETEDDGVASLSKIYFVNEIIYHGELAGEVVELGLDSLTTQLLEININIRRRCSPSIFLFG